jgi:hypothetical protein
MWINYFVRVIQFYSFERINTFGDTHLLNFGMEPSHITGNILSAICMYGSLTHTASVMQVSRLSLAFGIRLFNNISSTFWLSTCSTW